MRFRSPTNEPISVANIYATAAVVTREWRELPPGLHARALELGCQFEGMSEGSTAQVNADPPPGNLPDDRIRVVLAAIMRDPKPGELTGSGVPNMNTLAKTLGHAVNKDDAMNIWAELQAAPPVVEEV